MVRESLGLDKCFRVLGVKRVRDLFKNLLDEMTLESGQENTWIYHE